MYKKQFYTAVILLAFLTIGIRPAFADIIFPDDTYYFERQGSTNVYVLKYDVSDTIILRNPNYDGNPGPGHELNRLTLEGDEHTVSVSSGYGISFYYPDIRNGYITVQNLKVINCDVGINIQYATRINVIDTNISSCDYGINIGNAGTCIIRDNTISDCSEYGIELNHGINNTIYNNNFLNRAGFQAHVYGDSSGNVFDLGDPALGGEGGNYWSDYTGLDSDGDGIGDTPYEDIDVDEPPYTLLDNYPLMPTVETKLQELIDTVEGMNLQQGIDNSLDVKLDAALNALDDVNQNNDVAAINSLNAFISAVEAQRGNKITDVQADTLVADANYIITLLGG